MTNYAVFEGASPSPKKDPFTAYRLRSSTFLLDYEVEGLPFPVPYGSTRCCPSSATVTVHIEDGRPRWKRMEVRGDRADKHGNPTNLGSNADFAPYNSDKMPDYLGEVAMAAESRVRNWIEGNC